MSNSEQGFAERSDYPRWFVWYLRLFLAVVIVAGGLWIHKWLIDTTPEMQRRPSGERTAIVETKPLRRESKRVTVLATGAVIPVRELALRGRVSGEAIEVHPELEPGGRLNAGDVALRLDEADYKLALSQTEATLRDAEEQLKQIDVQEANFGQSLTITKRSVELSEAELGRINALLRSNTSSQSIYDTQERAVLTLRGQALAIENSLRLVPAQRITAQAKIDRARADVEQARLDLKRTVILCPFNAIVTERFVTLGAQVNAQTELARLVDIDAYWVEVPLPADRLDWIALPNGGSAPAASVTIRPSGANVDGIQWRGTVVRRQASIEENGRLARLLVRVEHPLEPGRAPLLLGAYVLVEIAGPLLENVFVLPRDAVRNGTEVWLLNGEGRLDIRDVKALWKDDDVIVARDGFSEGERLVLTDIASPIPGMKLDLPEEAARKRAEADKREGMGGGGAPRTKGGASNE